MREFWMKSLSLLLIAGTLCAYQECAVTRSESLARYKEEESRAAELEKSYAEIEALAEEYQKSMESPGAGQEAAGVSPEASAGADQAADSAAAADGWIDGVYAGTASGFGGDITVEVKVEGAAITAIDVTSHAGEDAAYFEQAAVMTDRILEAQSTDVDTVSGATYSSTGIRQAVENALEDAK